MSDQIQETAEHVLTADSFFFIRHGQTDANLKEMMCGGEWDIELNSTGLQQARAAQRVVAQFKQIKTICCSPMQRARQTAEIVNQALSVPIVLIDDLKEWLVGDWERMAWADIPNPFHAGADPPGGESRVQFEARVALGMARARQEEGPVLIVAHGGVFHAMCTPLGVDRMLIENCVLHKIYRENEISPWRIEAQRGV